MFKYIFLLFAMTFSLYAKTEKQTICLNMIVKDESRVIKRCLDSVMPLIDYWVIVDTGSTDGTQEVIKEYLKDIPGELHERPWKNFGYNRTEAFELAKDKAEYVLFMDADDLLSYESVDCFSNLNEDVYQMWRGSSDFTYLTPQLVKSTLPWRWEGVVHEYLTTHIPHNKKILENVKYVSCGGGGSYSDPNKFHKYVALLEKGLEEEPYNSRYMFYMGESYKDAGEPFRAMQAYQKRIQMGGWDEETFYSLLQIGKMQSQLDYPNDVVIESFNKAHRFRPHRLEPIYYLSELYNKIGRYDLAYECIKAKDFILKPETPDILFNEAWVDKWGLKFQLSICSYYLGHFDESLALCDELIKMNGVPKCIVDRTKDNRQFPIQKLIENSGFHHGGSIVNKINEGNKTLTPTKIADKTPFYAKHLKSKKEAETDSKTVLLAILAKDKAHVLPYFLHCVDNLEYDKKLITVYINTNNNSDNTKEILENWIVKNKHAYKDVIFDYHEVKDLSVTHPHEWTPQRFSVLGQIRNKSMKMTKECGCDYYFVIDCDNFIAPYTLRELVAHNKPIIAPMLRAVPFPKDPYSNFFCDVDEWGYYSAHPDYYKILNQDVIGTFKVPLVHTTYLIKNEYIDKLTYVDGTTHHEFVIFARSARDNDVEQYICNEKNFGIMLHFNLDNITVEQEENYLNQYLKVQSCLKDSGLLQLFSTQLK